MSEFIEINNISKSYNHKGMAVDTINLKLPKGKIIGLLGPNGSGKTTLIKMMNGLLEPDQGEILINGVPVGNKTKSMVAYLPDRTYLEPGQKISEIIDYFEDFYADFSREKAMEMLAGLNIDPSAKLSTLSKGNKEKVQLILVMSRQALLYILDEPIAGVDPAARDYILRTILEKHNPEASVILSTHLIHDIEDALEEVVFMYKGKLVLYTSVDNIKQQHGKTVDAYFREVFAC